MKYTYCYHISLLLHEAQLMMIKQMKIKHMTNYGLSTSFKYTILSVIQNKRIKKRHESKTVTYTNQQKIRKTCCSFVQCILFHSSLLALCFLFFVKSTHITPKYFKLYTYIIIIFVR